MQNVENLMSKSNFTCLVRMIFCSNVRFAFTYLVLVSLQQAIEKLLNNTSYKKLFNI